MSLGVDKSRNITNKGESRMPVVVSLNGLQLIEMIAFFSSIDRSLCLRVNLYKRE